MSTQKHTQGPFHITTNTTSGQFGTETKIRDAQNSVIAVLHVNTEGNGPLLCAAPDLLAALKLAATMKEPKDKIERMIWNGHQQIIREVIAKAEGVK
jgi:hypothetical protein